MNKRTLFPTIGRFFPMFIAVFMVIMSGCVLFDLNAPTWDVHFAIPLINKTYTMDEFVEEEDDLIVNDNGLVAYTLTGEIDTTDIGKHLKSDDIESELFFYVDEDFTSNTQNGEARLSEEYLIIEAEVLSGELYIETNNPTRYEVDAWFNFSDFRNVNIPGITCHPDEGNRVHGPFPLDGAIVSTDPQDNRSIRYSVTTQKVGQGPNGLDAGNIDVTVRIVNLVFKSVSGILHQVDVPLDTVETEMNLPEQLEGIQFGPLTLELHIQNGVDVYAEADIQFEAVNKDGEVKTITAGGPIEGSTESILEVAGFEEIINHFPEQLYFYGRLLLGDGQTQSTVHHDDIISGSYVAEVPLVFSLFNNVTETEPDTIEMDEDSREAIRDNLLEAHLVVEAFNHLPIGATVEIIFAADSQSVYSPNADVVKVLQMISGETPDGPDGTLDNPLPVVGEGKSEIDFGLTREELNVFDRDMLFFGTRVTFENTPGFVQVSPEDYIKLRAWIDATIHAEVPEDDEDDGEEEGGEV